MRTRNLTYDPGWSQGLPSVLLKMSGAVPSVGNIFLSQPLAYADPRRGAKGSWVIPESSLPAVPKSENRKAGNSRIDG